MQTLQMWNLQMWDLQTWNLQMWDLQTWTLQQSEALLCFIRQCFLVLLLRSRENSFFQRLKLNNMRGKFDLKVRMNYISASNLFNNTG